MKILRNSEFRRELILYLSVTAVGALLGFWLGPSSGLLALGVGLVFCLVFILSGVRRYRALAELARTLDRILHGQEQVLIEDQREGELSILRTELQKMTLRLKEQTDLLSVDKLRLTEAIQDIFHQIRTPLTSMNLLLSLLGEENLPPERRLSMTRELRRQLERVQWLVETLLKLSKLDAGTAYFQKEAVSLAELVRTSAEPLQIPLELRGQTLEVRIGEESFIGDLRWTAEAVTNILKNCMEHTPAGGTITVQGEETALFTELRIRDTGPGFAPGDLPHLFDRFYRGRGAGEESVGIGLALSRSILAAQNGTIKAENAPEGGARFTIRFYKSVV